MCKSMAYILPMNTSLMTVVETPAFLRKAKGFLSEEERADLVAFLAENPQAGVIMPETGGVRKLRWARPGEGKSGGYRVIYYFHSEAIPLLLLTLYGKNEKSNLTMAERNMMRQLTAALAEYGRKKHE